jgi:hypothetical protein
VDERDEQYEPAPPQVLGRVQFVACSNVLAKRAAQASLYLVEPDFFLSSEGIFPLLSAGTTFARCLAAGARIP